MPENKFFGTQSGIEKQEPVPEKAHFGHELFKKGEVVPEKACFGHKV